MFHYWSNWNFHHKQIVLYSSCVSDPVYLLNLGAVCAM